MPSAGFRYANPAIKPPQTYALGRTPPGSASFLSYSSVVPFFNLCHYFPIFYAAKDFVRFFRSPFSVYFPTKETNRLVKENIPFLPLQVLYDISNLGPADQLSLDFV